MLFLICHVKLEKYGELDHGCVICLFKSAFENEVSPWINRVVKQVSIINSLENSSLLSNMLLTSTICKRQELNSVLAKMKTTTSYFVVVLHLSSLIVMTFLWSVQGSLVCLTCFNILQILRFYQRKGKVGASLLLWYQQETMDLRLHKRLLRSYMLRFYKAFLKGPPTK